MSVSQIVAKRDTGIKNILSKAMAMALRKQR